MAPRSTGAAAIDWTGSAAAHLAAFALAVLLPAQWREGWPVWDSPAELIVQALLGGVGYLLAALLLERLPSPRRLRVVGILLRPPVAVALAFALLVGLPLLLPDIPLSRGLLVGAALVSLTALLLQQLPGRAALVAPLLLAIAVAGVLRAGWRVTASEDFTVDTEFYLLDIGVHRTPELARDLAVEGGGLARLGPEMLHVTGAGRFSRVTPGPGGSLAVTPLDLASPANAQAFREQAGGGVHTEWFRVIDLLAEMVGDSVRVLVTHHHWDVAQQCFTLRVSEATAGVSLAGWTPWRAVFDARPCLRIRRDRRGLPFQGTASGGRMVRVPEGILLTVGDHQFDGLNATEVLPQDSGSDYGKIVLLRPDGSSRIFSSGHRNPQGLARDVAGRIWATEHGPQGGDELNLVEADANYGWPWRTYGTEYGTRSWPLLRPSSAAFREPVYSFVPSAGLSNLVAPRSERLAAWSSSLLVGTLRVRELLRVQLDGTRPVYVEEIRVGFEFRDIEEAEDGTLVVWTDQGALLTIRPSETDRAGASLALSCAGCHTLNEGQRGALGPNLFRIVGRPVAASGDFAYSEALRAIGGRWTEARLDAFLRDPQGLVPGTTMTFPGIADSALRRDVIEYLGRTARRR